MENICSDFSAARKTDHSSKISLVVFSTASQVSSVTPGHKKKSKNFLKVTLLESLAGNYPTVLYGKVQ